MTCYVVDETALIAGLTRDGSEHHQREISRLLHGAIEGGPRVEVPALCLAAAAVARPAIAGHLADVIASAPRGSVGVGALERGEHLNAVLAFRGDIGWTAIHAAARALESEAVVLTVTPDRYAGMDLEVLSL